MLTCRKATASDVMTYYKWINDEEVRKQSFQTGNVSLEEHTKWFLQKIQDVNCIMLLFEGEHGEGIGQVRFQKEDEEGYMVGISVAAVFRGKGYASTLLKDASSYFFNQFPGQKIYAYIKGNNLGSIRSFEKAGFTFSRNLLIAGSESVLYTKIKNDGDR